MMHRRHHNVHNAHGGPPTDRYGAAAWVLCAFVFFTPLTLAYIAFDVFVWSIAGWAWGLIFAAPWLALSSILLAMLRARSRR